MTQQPETAPPLELPQLSNLRTHFLQLADKATSDGTAVSFSHSFTWLFIHSTNIDQKPLRARHGGKRGGQGVNKEGNVAPAVRDLTGQWSFSISVCSSRTRDGRAGGKTQAVILQGSAQVLHWCPRVSVKITTDWGLNIGTCSLSVLGAGSSKLRCWQL